MCMCYFSNRLIGTLPCCALGAQIPPLHIFDIDFFLLLAHAGCSNPAGL